MKTRRSFRLLSTLPLAFAALFAALLSDSHCARAQRLSTNVLPFHYALSLAPDLKTGTFTGSEDIEIHIKERTRTITLNAVELQFGGVEIRDRAGRTQAGSVSLDSAREQATLTFEKTIPAGDATLHVNFKGTLNSKLRGFYLSRTARRSYAVSQFEPIDARRAFPCFDEPAMKATFDVSLKIDRGDTAISNSAIVSDSPDPGASKHTVTFGRTPKMSTYLVAFIVGDFQCSGGEQDGVALRVCATPDKVALTPYALNVAKFALHYYNDYFGIHYPLQKLDLIGIPDFESGAMENFGAITFRETTLLLDPKTASLRAQRAVTIDIAHEMAHQWFGDLVTMHWWDNLWLNEGFASWMENKCTAAMHPEWNIPQTVAAEEQDTLDIDAQPTTRAIRAHAETRDEIEQLFDGIAYGKASDVLLMVENYTGEETFRRGVHAYLTTHAYGNATAEDFWTAQTGVSHRPIDKIMDSLVAQPGVPILQFGVPASDKVQVFQSRFFLRPGINSNPEETWTLPVCFKATANSKDCKVLASSSNMLLIPAGEPFFANAGGKGYYRSAYAPAQYAALVERAETALTPAERISLTGDEWAQVRTGKASIGDYLDLVAALRGDPSSGVFASAVDKLGNVTSRIAATGEERSKLAAWIRQTFLPVYVRLGDASPADSPNKRELHAHIFTLLGIQGDEPGVKAEARHIADRYLSDPTSVDPNLGQAALSIAARNGDAALFDKLQATYETSIDPELQTLALHNLVAFRNPDLLHRALAYSVSSKVRNQDSALLFATAMSISDNRDQTWDFIKTHWNEVKAEFTPEMGEYFVASTGYFCSAEARDDVRSFFSSHPVPAAESSVQHAIESIDGCIELRHLQEPNLQKWLSGK